MSWNWLDENRENRDRQMQKQFERGNLTRKELEFSLNQGKKEAWQPYLKTKISIVDYEVAHRVSKDWKAIKARLIDSDEIYYYQKGEGLAGAGGLVVVRGNEVVAAKLLWKS